MGKLIATSNILRRFVYLAAGNAVPARVLGETVYTKHKLKPQYRDLYLQWRKSFSMIYIY